jgi:NTP pyrophosphatase (non-canonical NTP hydrolase)
MIDLCFEVLDPGKAVLEENQRQLDKWGVQDRSCFEWLAYTTEELGELSNAISEHYYRQGDRDDVVEEAIQVATLALKIAEMYRHIRTLERDGD